MTFDYIKSFQEGHAYNKKVGDILSNFGVPGVVVPDWSMHKDQDELENKTKNEKDVIVDGLVLEVKSRGFTFNTIDDFPYEKIIIDTVYGFDQKVIKPFAYVYVSQTTQNMFVVPVATKEQWTIGTIYDKQREIEIDCYFVTKRHCRPFIELVDVLLERASDRATEV